MLANITVKLCCATMVTIDICRLCLSTFERSIPKISIFHGEPSYASMIRITFNFQINYDDGLPSYICLNCSEETVRTYGFKLKCIESYNFLCKRLCEDEKPIVSSLETYNCKIREKDPPNHHKDSDLNNSIANSEKIECKLCNLSFLLKTDYIKHKRLNHKKKKAEIEKRKVFSCPKCVYKSNSKTKLAIHSNNHSMKRQFNCIHCDFKTSFKNSLKIHTRSHTGEKPFTCKVCDQKFKQLAHLKQHELTHSEERPWACHLCEYRAKAKKHLMGHLKIHTDEKPFMCDLCSFTCSNSFNLTSHKLSHSEIKLFKCDLCDYSSNFKKNLSMHILKHSGVKTFQCDLCEYKAVCAQHLKSHMVSHSEERPFSCELCSHHTKTNSLLKKHLKKHSKQ